MKEKVEIEKVYTRKKNGAVPTLSKLFKVQKRQTFCGYRNLIISFQISLVKFQNGRLSAFTKENTHFTRLRNKEEPNKFGALLAANGSLYHGHINNTEASDLTDTYICVRNKKTNQVIT